MDTNILLIAGVAIAFLIGGIGWLLVQHKSALRYNVLEDQIRQKELQIQQSYKEITALQSEKERLLQALAIAQTQLLNTTEQLTEAKANHQQISEQLKLEMHALANQLMKQNSQEMVLKNEEK